MIEPPSSANGDRRQPAAPFELRRLLAGRSALYGIPTRSDDRGELLPLDHSTLPFAPVRTFIVFGAPDTVRGGHAHATGHQLLCCLTGEVVVELRHAGDTEAITLSSPTQALLIGPGVWAEQHYGAAGGTLLVFASEHYDPASYRTDAT